MESTGRHTAENATSEEVRKRCKHRSRKNDTREEGQVIQQPPLNKIVFTF
jgi:hypothetical protein